MIKMQRSDTLIQSGRLNPGRKTALLAALPVVYERNYSYLLELIPELGSLHDRTRITLSAIEHLEIVIREQSPFTTVLDIDHVLDNAHLPDLGMSIRAYHDARMAEVIRYQRHSRIQPSYAYPNKAMYQPLEKRQINLFFSDWLKHCFTISWQTGIQTTPTST
jgi:uncharacterized protein YqiB (DUF1249 family)